MTAITWHAPGDKTYEAGLDRGVLYVDGKTGVPWNGLTRIEEKVKTKVDPIYYDGVKVNDIVTIGDLQGTIRAVTYPDEFLECEGVGEDQTGVYLTEQPVKRFGLCFRTKIGEGNDDPNSGYKIHLYYNLTAVPSNKRRNTLSLNTEPEEFSWDISAIPEPIEGHKPTSHMIVDSRQIDPWLLADLEDILYGNGDSDSKLPDLKSITTFIRKWDRLIITDNGDGTWTAISAREDIITEIGPTEYTITSDDVVQLDPNTYTISSSDKNEEDI